MRTEKNAKMKTKKEGIRLYIFFHNKGPFLNGNIQDLCPPKATHLEYLYNLNMLIRFRSKQS
jgi:hypothetical protein